MSEKELNQCCGGSCGCEGEDNQGSCGCGGHNHDHGNECGCGEEHYETFVVDLEDENGNIVSCDVVEAFEYKNSEYVLVENPQDNSIYLFRSQGEEGELVVPSEEEFAEVTKYYEEELSE
ncbi:DUF1292 domain-containing protein [Sarcina sp. JB2]|uniref:DUF1292 domain-containing protein n=1 Tax=Candidatus Sarcina troglodytae TaxID=2726954 RepID=A0ACD1BEL6_9CLOT|nr:DUF1292 domain-containing protein [Sarcina sp. JB2]QPJ85941.1 DUF1292 domain-containing protein [Sarcina sp. JB2]